MVKLKKVTKRYTKYISEVFLAVDFNQQYFYINVAVVLFFEYGCQIKNGDRNMCVLPVPKYETYGTVAQKLIKKRCLGKFVNSAIYMAESLLSSAYVAILLVVSIYGTTQSSVLLCLILSS